MRHMAYAGEAMLGDEPAQAVRVMGRRYAILDPKHDLGWRPRRGQKTPDVERLSAACENGLSQPPLFRNQRPFLPLPQRRPGERRAQRNGVDDQHSEPGREACLSVGLQKAVEEGCVGFLAETCRRDQHQR